MDFDETFPTDDMISIESGLKEFQSQKIRFHSVDTVTYTLKRVWDYGLGDPLVRSQLTPRIGIVRYSIRPSVDSPHGKVFEKIPIIETKSWFLGMSKEFLSAIDKLDRKVQGRILQAIGYIVGDPLKIKGDTVKPLKGEEGLWRYRIGDYRLVYYPDIDNSRVVLLAFTARGSAYH